MFIFMERNHHKQLQWNPLCHSSEEECLILQYVLIFQMVSNTNHHQKFRIILDFIRSIFCPQFEFYSSQVLVYIPVRNSNFEKFASGKIGRKFQLQSGDIKFNIRESELSENSLENFDYEHHVWPIGGQCTIVAVRRDKASIRTCSSTL